MNALTESSSHPFIIAMVTSALCGVGLHLFNNRSKSSKKYMKSSRILERQKFWLDHRMEIIKTSGVGAITGIVISLSISSVVIAVPFVFLSSAVTWSILFARKSKHEVAMANIWPEVIDHLISGIHSGLSLSETLVGLSSRGPKSLRPIFSEFHNELLQTGDFSLSVARLKSNFNSQSSDQILEALLLAKALGGSELLQIFRTLGDFLREDLALRKEIAIKHGWIKNSAHLSSAAPWILLLLLSSQPGTVDSFSSPGGIAILSIGMLMTMIAYLWMGRLSLLPKVPRIFAEKGSK